MRNDLNPLQKAYCDGAAMAYRDCAGQILTMIDKAPPEVREFVQYLAPLADANNAKALEVFEECKRYNAAMNGEKQ